MLTSSWSFLSLLLLTIFSINRCYLWKTRYVDKRTERERDREKETHLSMKFFYLFIHLDVMCLRTSMNIKLQYFLIDTFNLVLHYTLSETMKIVFLSTIFIKLSEVRSSVIISVKKDIALYTFVNTKTLVVLCVFRLLIQSFRRCSLSLHQ